MGKGVRICCSFFKISWLCLAVSPREYFPPSVSLRTDFMLVGNIPEPLGHGTIQDSFKGSATMERWEPGGGQVWFGEEEG